MLVDDDYTFQSPVSPHVQGATVNLLNPYDNTQVVATGVTDATGAVTFTNVPAGPYVLQVQATATPATRTPSPSSPGITNNDEVFIQRQFVTYTWNVVQTTIQDTYQIQLQTTFETDVPAPVVTITAPPSIPTLLPGQSGTFNVTITNHGLIAAQGVTLTLPTDPEYTFTALTTTIGVLPAQEFRGRPDHGDASGAPAGVDQRRRHDADDEGGGAQPRSGRTPPRRSTWITPTPAPSPMPGAALVLTATQNGNPGAFLSLDPSLAGLGYDSNTTPAGFSQTVQFLASGATPGMLEPGESVIDAGLLRRLAPIAVELGAAGHLQPQRGGHGQHGDHRLVVRDAGTSPRLDQRGRLERHLPDPDRHTWARPGASTSRPSTTTPSTSPASASRPPISSQLLSFEIEKANAAYTAQTLVSVTADSLPAPGMNLSFVQSFQQSISGRYTQGILGYGWTTNWDITATTMTNGDVAIEARRHLRYFSLQPDGSYAPQAGDEGTTLTVSGGAYQLVEPTARSTSSTPTAR